MNWEAISAIGEILGVIVVVVTLLFVVREVRQNSRSLAVAALRDTTQQWHHWSDMIATSGDLAEIVVKGNRDYESLTDSERLRYGAYAQAFFDNVESYRSLVIDHRLERDLEVLISITSGRLAIPGFSAWWSDNTSDYADDFVDWVESIRHLR